MNYITYQPCQQNQLPTPSNSSSNRKLKDLISSDDRPPISSTQLKKSVIQSLSHPKLKSTSPEDWDTDQVEIWLNAIDFGSIAANFKSKKKKKRKKKKRQDVLIFYFSTRNNRRHIIGIKYGITKRVGCTYFWQKI